MTDLQPITSIDWEDTESIGAPISGLYVDEHRFVSVMPFARLERLVDDPLTASNPKIREGSSRLSEYYELHAEIQRAFDAGKNGNAQAYAQYILSLFNGANGDTPTIDLYTPTSLPIHPNRNKVLFPYEVVA